MSNAVMPQFQIPAADRAIASYVEGVGFQVDWEHRFEPGFPVFLQLTRRANGIPDRAHR